MCMVLTNVKIKAIYLKMLIFKSEINTTPVTLHNSFNSRAK